MRFLIPILISATVLVPQGIADNVQSILEIPNTNAGAAHRIAIVGAGAAGSSAAYHLSQFARDAGLEIPLNITIFESEARVGGRTTTVNALNDPRYPVELGGSIFVEINRILFNATRDFNLPTNARIYESTGSDYDLGIWDGDSFIFTTANSDDDGSLKDRWSGWWDIAKLLWKYGFSPLRLRSLQRATIGRFLNMYDEFFPFLDLTQAAEEADLLSVTGTTGEKMLAAAGISEQFSREIIQASTRVNYAQNLPDFHGLETLVCMSTDGAMSIEGGNWQIFDQMIKHSQAKLRLNSTVTAVNTTTGSPTLTITNSEGATVSESFDTIILAHPYNSSMMTLTPPPAHTPHKDVAYVSLHVTLFTSPFRPSPVYFNLNPPVDSLVPDSILTTVPEALDPHFLGRGVEGVGPTGFWSLSTLHILNPSTDGYIPGVVSSGSIPVENLDMSGKQYLYKIFSPAPLTAEELVELFGWQDDQSLPADLKSNSRTQSHGGTSISALPDTLLTWSHEKVWNSYPYLPPRTEFDCFDVYNCSSTRSVEAEALARKLWYTSAIEPFICTMETSALSGRNIARLIVDGLA
ncbi:hypothetical protein H2198_010872 [Neophaeococcomyces mojaviensis]|uniref:Uncharacterized protein n=1 Tax=Neophaeococcomyces mojaviensis TaxID=3383035 RepID=A0ACC2ZNX5_9EURO|nr:hypothetical protein H2198_010872 [Knufia sp. JES_112]